jgi:hypothetical protein
VMIAAKIFGSRGRSTSLLLSPFMLAIIRNSDAQTHRPSENAAAPIRPATACRGAQG